MWGTFKMDREDGYVFECRIPPFSLESKPEEGSNLSNGDDSTNNKTTPNSKNDDDNV